jgi:protease-4
MMQKILHIFVLLISPLLFSGCFGIANFNIPTGNKVALIEIKGMIVEPDEVIEDLEKARKDKNVKAIVVRVDSPGGSVAASQEIFRTIKNLNKKKPVVISMGDVAASGGYYVSAGASKIFANEGTVTGSIGVRMELMNAKGLFALMRLEPETLKSGKFKDIGSPYRDLTPDERVILETFLSELHDQFKADVASARGLEADFVADIAQGQIYTGVKAKELGLIDELGGLIEATKKAAELAGIKGEPKTMKIRKKKAWWVNMFEGQVSTILGGLGSKLLGFRYFLYEWKPY